MSLLTIFLFINFMNRLENNLSCNDPILHVQSAAHVAYAFVNNTYLGTYTYIHKKFEASKEVTLVVN